MNPTAEIVGYTAAAGACIPLGAYIARVERIRPRWLENEFRHFVIAFGGGVLLAAVALVLLPEGIRYLPTTYAAIALFVAGGVTFFLIERALGLRRRESPQFSATLLDYIPETIALGGVFALGSETAPLLALFIGLQNLPEGFNAYRELMSVKGARSKRVLILMALLVPIGPAMGLAGWMFFSNYTAFLGALMLFASGGILYLIFQDIAPQSRLKRHWFPPLGAVLGFSVGLLGSLLIG
jgi:ZIP family zinc transporter